MDATPLSPSPALPQPPQNSPDPSSLELSSREPAAKLTNAPGGRSRIVWLLLQLKPGRKRSNANSNASGNASSAGDQSLTQMTTPTETDLTPVITSIKVPAEAIHTPMVPTPPPIVSYTSSEPTYTPPPFGLDPNPDENTPTGPTYPTTPTRGQVEVDRKDPIVGPLMLHNALDKFTPGPMPHIQDAHPPQSSNTSTSTSSATGRPCQCRKLIALPFDNKARTCANHEDIKGRIMAAVADITKSQEVESQPHVQAFEAVRAKYTPTAFLVYNLTAELRTRSLSAGSARDHECWVTSEELIKGVWSDDETSQFVIGLVNIYPDDEKEQVYTAIQEFLTSFYLTCLDIKRARDSLVPQYNVYANGRKVIELNIWSRIRRFLADRKYSARYLGTGTTDTKPFHCGICSSVDHPRGLCPFPGVEGWNGPKRRVNESMRGRNGNYCSIVFRTPGARASGSNGCG
ncbi:hypothetical protein EI94DRAFT_1710263 [Lactarius quietus]|nr:hypothetical protein EI94DRAFT_1710263 [Lactarius quietus]